MTKLSATNFDDLLDLVEMDDSSNASMFEESEDLFDLGTTEEDEMEESVVEFTPVTPPTTRRKVVASKPVVVEEPVLEVPVKATPVKPVAKTTTTKVASKPVEKPVKATEEKRGKMRVRTTTKAVQGYETLFGDVTAKVDKYNEIMEARRNGDKGAIPQSVVISRELLVSLLAAKFTEDNAVGVKEAMAKAMVSMGFDKEDVIDALSTYNVKKVEASAILDAVLGVMYDVVSSGAGLPLFKTEDCNCSLKGEWKQPEVRDNAQLKTDKATYIESYLRVSTSSPAPVNKKHLGTITSDGKFRPESK